MKYRRVLFALFLSLAALPALAATVSPDSNVTVTIPDDWNYVNHNFDTLTHPTVAYVLECVDDSPEILKRVGWKMDKGKVLGAYCISYRNKDMRPAGVMLQYSQGEEREKIAKKFTDTYAGEIQTGYAKRKIAIPGMSADLLEADRDFILLIEGRISGDTGNYVRSTTVVLHDDSLVNIGSVHAVNAPKEITDALEAMHLSVQWKK